MGILFTYVHVAHERVPRTKSCPRTFGSHALSLDNFVSVDTYAYTVRLCNQTVHILYTYPLRKW